MTAAAARIRATIVDALHDVEVADAVDGALLKAFEAGEGDVPLAEVPLDSMSRMELLVALETEYGTVILPNVFARYESLGDIVAYVEAGESENGSATAAEAQLESGVATAGEAAAPAPEPAARLARVFRRAFGHCRTVAEMHLLLGHLADRMSPLEAEAMGAWHRARRLVPADAPAKFGEAVSSWLDWLEDAMAGAGRSEPQAFVGRRLSPAVVHYTGPGERGGKRLLICYSVKGSRSLSISLPIFLQHVDASRYDVLILYDLWDTAFRAGVPFLGKTVHQVVDWVAGLEWIGEYAGIRTTGCSGGVYPAILTGRALGAELVVGLNGRFPSERHLATLLRMYFHCWRSARRSPEVQVLLTHGVTRSRDVAFARRLRWLTGVNGLAIEMPGREVAHNVLPPLLEHGELKGFLERTLFAETDSAYFAERRVAAKESFPAPSAAATD